MDIKNNDILALEGTILNTKFRIVLCYFDSTKLKTGKDYERNRKLQKEIEKLIEVEADTSLIILGDFNGRLTKLEPTIITDANGKMLEKWTEKYDVYRLNTYDSCNGTYTFHSLNGKSAIDHVLTNKTLLDKHISMYIDERRAMLNISDHNLVRVWFQLGNSNSRTNCKKKTLKDMTWISRDEDKLAQCAKSFKSKIGKKISFRKCIDKIKTSVDSTMKRRKKIRPGGKKGIKLLAAEWIDRELLDNIKLRSKLNREWRYARKRSEPKEILKQYEQRYLKQKSITALMTGDKKSAWESKKIEETWKDSKKFWVMIKELLGKNKELTDEAFVYTEQGEKQEIMTCKNNFIQIWTENVYQKLEKADFSFWNGDDKHIGMKQLMEEEMTKEDSEIMSTPIITEKEFTETINNMKNNRASGVDNIPAELMKVLIKDEQTRKYLLKCFNRALTERVHEDWLLSRTTMIPKTNKPMMLEHRPIAVTVNSSKIVCTILRKKIEEFLSEKGIKYNNQFGFTEGGRVEHCMFMLDYVTNMSFEKIKKRGASLYYAFIDFKKAYDSIDRKKLIEVLVDFKINPQIIDIIVQMYQDDNTVIKLGNMKEKVEVTGGIRQGCCISTLLFKMVTFKIIDELRSKKKYKVGKFNDNSLWLADDATLIADSMDTLRELLNCLSTAGAKYGLEINEKKTKIMRVRGPDDYSQIGNYDMVTETKYLGITVGGRGRNIFEKENKEFLTKAEKKVNSLMAQIKKSADKVLVGKAIWKLMAIPAILFGRAIVTTCAARIEGLQRLENKVWRYLMDIGGYSTIDALRGEMGASLVKSRVMETMLLYVVDTMNSKFENMKEMMLDTIETGKGHWYTNINSYREELEISWEELYTMSKKELKNRIRTYDTEKWNTSLESKSTLKYYVQGKTKIGYEFCYRNNLNSTFLARARINSLKLEEAKGRGNPHYDRTCKLCREEEENIVHFLIDCKALEEERNYEIIDSSIENSEEKMIKLLFQTGKYQETGYMIKKLWCRRRTLLEKNQKKKEYKEKNNGQLPNLVVYWNSDPGPMRRGHDFQGGRSLGKNMMSIG